MLTFLATRPEFYKIRPFPLIGVVTAKSVFLADSWYPRGQAYYPHLACPVCVRGLALCATLGITVKDSEGVNTGPASCSSSRREALFIYRPSASKPWCVKSGENGVSGGKGRPKTSSCEGKP